MLCFGYNMSQSQERLSAKQSSNSCLSVTIVQPLFFLKLHYLLFADIHLRGEKDVAKSSQWILDGILLSH